MLDCKLMIQPVFHLLVVLQTISNLINYNVTCSYLPKPGVPLQEGCFCDDYSVEMVIFMFALSKRFDLRRHFLH